jgi:hypothetical protein
LVFARVLLREIFYRRRETPHLYCPVHGLYTTPAVVVRPLQGLYTRPPQTVVPVHGLLLTWVRRAAPVYGLNMLDVHILEELPAPGARSAEEAIRRPVTELVRRFNGFPGKVAMEILAEGQSDPGVLQEYRDRYLSNRRAVATEVIERAQASGEFRKDIEPQVLIDMIFGPIYFRRLVRHQKLDERFANELVDRIIAYVKS